MQNTGTVPILKSFLRLNCTFGTISITIITRLHRVLSVWSRQWMINFITVWSSA